MARARLLLVLTLLLGSVLACVPPIAGPAARAATRDAAPATLTVAIDDISPLAPVEASTLIVRGSVSNLGTAPVSALQLSLLNNGSAETRADLGNFRADPSVTGQPLVTKALPKALAGGASRKFVLTVPMIGNLLGVPSRVYKLSVVASGAVTSGGAVAPLGVSGLPLPYFTPTTPIMGSLRTALVIPMTEVPDQGPAPLLGAAPEQPSKQLITDLSPGGRLDRLVSIVQAAPPAGGIAGTRLTLAIDPALLDRVCALAGRCKQHLVVGTPAGDNELAVAWLNKLSAAVESSDVTVVGLPYADADLGAMTNAGDTHAVEQLLQSAGGLVDADLTSAATSDLQPLLPVDGVVDDALGSAAFRAGSSVAVLSPALFQPVVPAADQPVTPTASTILHTGAGSMAALVMDQPLEDLLSTVADRNATPRMQEQNLLAELAVITSERPNEVAPQRTVVLEAPRDWNVSLDYATHLVDALGGVSYVSSEGLETLENAPPVERTLVGHRPSTGQLPASTVQTVDNARSAVAALKAVAADPDTEIFSRPYGEGLDRCLSAWWRGAGAAAGATLLASVTNDLTSTMERVQVNGGKNGVLLTGPSGMLPVQVSNLLPEAIAVVIHVKSGGLDQVTGRDLAVHLDQGSAKHQESVEITTRSTRDVDVTLQLLAQSDENAQIAVATIRVRSSSVGKVAVGITATALTFLVLLILFRGARRMAARRRGESPA